MATTTLGTAPPESKGVTTPSELRHDDPRHCAVAVQAKAGCRSHRRLVDILLLGHVLRRWRFNRTDVLDLRHWSTSG